MLRPLGDRRGGRLRQRVGALVVGLAVVCGAGLGCAVAASAATWYAYAGTSNADPGPSGCPLSSAAASQCSLAQALANAQPGDTVQLEGASSVPGAPSVYYGNWTLETAETSESQPVTLDGNGQTLDGDQGGTTGACETSTNVGQPASDCTGAVLTVGGTGGYYMIEDLTIQYANNKANGFGGGLETASGASVGVSDVTFAHDDADRGGGAIDDGSNGGSGSVAVSDSDFESNSATDGGAIDNGDESGSGSVSVSDSTFQSNSGTDGGAIDNGDESGSGSVSVSNSTFANNSAGYGGAIVDGSDGGSGSLSVFDSTFATNRASHDGGAIDNGESFAAAPSSGLLSVSGVTFANNVAGYGGAIANGSDGGSGSLAVSDSTFATNDASNDGGAIDDGEFYGAAPSSGLLSVSGSTFIGDGAAHGPSIDTADNSGSASVWVAGDVFGDVGPVTASGCDDNHGSWFDEGTNVVLDGDYSCLGGPSSLPSSDAQSSTGDTTQGSYGPAASSIGLDPDGLQANGGSTDTIGLEPDSPAVGIIPPGTTATLGPDPANPGQDLTVPLCSDGANDQRGESRPGGAVGCDAGAFELQAQTQTTETCAATVTFGASESWCSATAAGAAPSADAALTGPPSGQIVFTVYPTSDCSTSPGNGQAAQPVSGDAPVTLAPVASVEPGAYWIKASFTDPVTSGLAFQDSSACEPITIQGRATTTLTASPQIVLDPPPTAAGLFHLSATLSSDGTPVGEQTVAFTARNGTTLCTAPTNQNGIATCQLRLLDELRVLLGDSYTATFTTTGGYAGATSTVAAIELGTGRHARPNQRQTDSVGRYTLTIHATGERITHHLTAL